jgi:hypothetical protein
MRYRLRPSEGSRSIPSFVNRRYAELALSTPKCCFTALPHLAQSEGMGRASWRNERCYFGRKRSLTI